MMISLRILKIFPFFLVAAGLAAQTGVVRGPVSGYVFDQAARAVRPIVGIPGASYLGAPVVSETDFASVSPDGKSALTVTAGRLYLVRGLGSGTLRWSALEEKTDIDRAAWSADSARAVVYSSATGKLRLWSGLDRESPGASTVRPSPRSARGATARRGTAPRYETADLGRASNLGGAVSALAAGVEGDAIVGITGQTTGGLYRMREAAAPSLITRVSAPGGIAIGEAGQLYVADRNRGEILEIRNYSEAADVTLLAGADRGVRTPVALALAADGKSLLVASAGERALVIYNLASRALTARLELDFEPTELRRLGGGPIYLMNSREGPDDTVHVFAGGRRPAVFFVPAARVAVNAPVED